MKQSSKNQTAPSAARFVYVETVTEAMEKWDGLCLNGSDSPVFIQVKGQARVWAFYSPNQAGRED